MDERATSKARDRGKGTVCKQMQGVGATTFRSDDGKQRSVTSTTSPVLDKSMSANCGSNLSLSGYH